MLRKLNDQLVSEQRQPSPPILAIVHYQLANPGETRGHWIVLIANELPYLSLREGNGRQDHHRYAHALPRCRD